VRGCSTRTGGECSSPMPRPSPGMSAATLGCSVVIENCLGPRVDKSWAAGPSRSTGRPRPGRHRSRRCRSRSNTDHLGQSQPRQSACGRPTRPPPRPGRCPSPGPPPLSSAHPSPDRAAAPVTQLTTQIASVQIRHGNPPSHRPADGGHACTGVRTGRLNTGRSCSPALTV
jgi:hypothetical protein